MKLNSFTKKILSVILIIGLLFFWLHHVDHPQQTTNTQIITAELTTAANTLYYTGNIEPLKNTAITSPADAVIEQTYFHYGDQVKRDTLLFTLSSQKLLKDYRDGLMQYIKAKSEFLNNQNNLQQTKFLHDKQLISDDEFHAKQNAFWQARLSLVQAKAALDNISQQLGHKNTNITDLSIKDISPIIQALHTDANTLTLEVHAPSDGLILQPYQTDNTVNNSSKKLVRGAQVKQGDVLALMGNTDKILVPIQVNESNINQLKLNQAVTITSDALPGVRLDGIISSIDHQGERSNSGPATFAVEVTANHLTPAEQAIIHIGMRAQVAMTIKQQRAISVPIKAVKQKDFSNWLTIYDAKTKKTHDTKIQTGQTTQDTVMIISGIQPGDQIVVPD